MTIETRLKRDLTEDEKKALSHYGADSAFLHAVAQECERDLDRDPQWQEFWPSRLATNRRSAYGRFKATDRGP